MQIFLIDIVVVKRITFPFDCNLHSSWFATWQFERSGSASGLSRSSLHEQQQERVCHVHHHQFFISSTIPFLACI